MDLSWPAEFVPLALLQVHSRHGYDLHRAISDDAVLRSIWRLGRSELYFLLKKLEKRGWILPQPSEPGQGPPRTTYAISKAGLLALRTWLASPVPTPRDLRAEFLAKVYLGWKTGAPETRDLLQRQSQILQDRLIHLEAGSRSTGFVRHVHHLRQLQTRAALRWLEELAPSLGDGPEAGALPSMRSGVSGRAEPGTP